MIMDIDLVMFMEALSMLRVQQALVNGSALQL